MYKRKYIILFLVLILPGIIFIIFDKLQPDYKPLPILGPRYQSLNSPDTSYHQIADIKVVDHHGRLLNLSDYSDKILICNFFFTSCPSPDFCPLLSSNMNKLQAKLIQFSEIVLLSFTVDPAKDSVPVLKTYADKYLAKKNKWYFLTGNKENIYELAEKSFLVGVTHGGNNPDAFLHTDRFILIDKEKRIRGFYNGRDDEDIKHLITDVKILMKEYTYKKVKQNKIEYKPQQND